MSLLYNEMTSGIHNQNEYKLFNEGNSVSFITFNYDRVLEYFFWESLMNKFDLTSEQSNELVMGLNIYHVFGRLPSFNHESIRSGVQMFPYQNFGITRSDYKYAIENIKTLHERNNVDESKISKLIGDAERIFFLGFGFAEENLALLNFNNNVKKRVEVYSTTYGLSESKREAIRWTLANAIKIHFKNDNIRARDNTFMFPYKSKKLLEEQIVPPPQEKQSSNH